MEKMDVMAEIRARRVKGGAIVRVIRNGCEHRYRVGLRRYNRLQDTLVVHENTAGGAFTGHGFEARLLDVAGLRESREWVQRYGNRRAKHWR